MEGAGAMAGASQEGAAEPSPAASSAGVSAAQTEPAAEDVPHADEEEASVDAPLAVAPEAAPVVAAATADDGAPGAGGGAANAPAQPPELPIPVYTPPADTSISMTFCNPASFGVKIYWLRPGKAELVGPGTLVLPSQSATVKTYRDHKWYVFMARQEDLQYYAHDPTIAHNRTGIHLVRHQMQVMRDVDNQKLSPIQQKELRDHLESHRDKATTVGIVPEVKPELPAPPPMADRLRVVRVYLAFGRRQECDVVTGAYTDRNDGLDNADASEIAWPNDKYTDQLKRLDFDQLRHMLKLLSVGSYDYSAHMCTPARKLNLVQIITSKLKEFRGMSMPKLRAEAMNAGVDPDDFDLGVEFERTLSANSKLLKQSSKFEVDEHDDVPADPEDREEIVDKIMSSLMDGTKQYAAHPKIQAILDAQYAPVMCKDETKAVSPAPASATADAGASSAGVPFGAASASDAPSDQTSYHPAHSPPGEFMLAKLAPDMIRAVCTHLALTIQGGPQLKRLQATCRGMRDALAADEPEIHELWELAARSRFVEEIDELLPADIEQLQDVDTVTIIRADARTAQAFDNGLSAHVKREVWSPTPLPRKPGRPSSGGVPPVLRPENVGFGAYKRLHELRAQFKQTVTVVRGSISDLPFRVDAIVLPSDESSVLDVGFGACGAIYRAANGPGGYARYEGNPVGTVLPSPSFAMSDRCTTLLHSVGPTWPIGTLDSLGRAVRWCRLNGGEEKDHAYSAHTWGWYKDVDGTLTGAADGLGYGTAEEAEINMEPQFVARAALIKYHATMLRRQLVRDLCVVYENIFDQAAEHECKSIALPGISTGSRGFPNITAAAIAMDVVQQRIAAGTCPEKVYFVAFDDASNIYGAFSDVRHEILRRYELLIRPVTAKQPWVWRGGGWRGISERYDADQTSALTHNRNYLASLEQNLEEMDPADKAGELGASLMTRLESARSQVANAEREIAQAEEDEEARKKYDAEHGVPEGVPGEAAPEPEQEDGAHILDAIDEEYTLMPLRRSITIHSVDLAKEHAVAKRAATAYTYMMNRF